MYKQWEMTIPQLSGKEKRRIHLYLPKAYEEDPQARFPVMYMFDGQNVFLDQEASFGKSWGMYQYMNNAQTQLIIVGVECSKTSRMAEYSPFTHDNGMNGERVYARGRTYMNWLTGVLKPMIDRKYRTLPDRENTIIAGSSMGGLMSLYAALNYNHVFSRAACLSASLWVHPGKVMHMIRSAQISPDTCIYLDYGTEEIANHPENPKVLFDACQALLYQGVNLAFRIVPGGSHCEASWEKQVPVFMKCLGF